MSETAELAPTFTLTLKRPIQFEGREYSEIILQEPTTKTVLRAEEHLRNGASMPALRNREIHLVALSAGVPVPVVEQMKISDLNRSIAYLSPFLTDGQATGGS